MSICASNSIDSRRIIVELIQYIFDTQIGIVIGILYYITHCIHPNKNSKAGNLREQGVKSKKYTAHIQH